ncbi:hypothetical protein F5Y05DRAFT_151795 [Hypoxylon sp. FL0543]|nr:hypothetical protein F5Y05DRAFT_151795 [Hypoxylon sp. FL0543]
MPAVHRPDYELFMELDYDVTKAKVEDGRLDKFLEPFLWPYITLEDMCKTEPLLMMLNSRGRCTPDTFAYSDLQSICFGLRSAFVPQTKLPRHYMIFRERDSPQTYGQLYDMDDSDETQTEPTRFWYTPGNGLCLLHVQSRIYEFLFRCCTLILHDLPQEVMLPAPEEDAGPEIEALDISGKTNLEGVTTLSTEAFESRYKEPDSPDFRRVATLIQAKLSSAEDHLLGLREDPGYFAAFMKERYEHLVWRLLDTNDQPDFTSLCGQAEAFSGAVICSGIREAIEEVGILNTLYKKVSRLREAMDPESTKIAPNEDLPPKLAETLYDAYYFIASSVRALIGVERLGVAIYCSPPIRAQFRRPAPGYCGTGMKDEDLPTVIPRYTSDYTQDQHRLTTMLRMVVAEELVYIMGTRGLATEVDYLTRRDPQLKHLISPWLADQVSTVCVLLECLHQLELFLPWMHGYEMHYAEHADQYRANWEKANLHSVKALDMGIDFWYGLSPLLDGFKVEASESLAQKPPCKEVVETKRNLEAALDSFWDAITSALKKNNAMSPRALYVFSLKVQRTPAWTEPPAAAKKGKNKGDKAEESFDQLMEEARKVNEKLKKDIEGEDSDVGIYKVDKRSLKVFNVLLFDGPDASQLGEVSWNDFVHAMQDMGFAPMKLYAFAWLFEPIDKFDSTDEPIVFMEPYQTGKLTYLAAKHYGRRLTRAYGWKRSMFELDH